MKKSTWLLGVLVAAAVASPLTLAAEEKVFELKYSIWSKIDLPANKGYRQWAKAVEEESNGTIKVKFFDQFQLGKPIEHYEMVRKGVVDLGFISTGYYMPKNMLATGAMMLPFTVNNGDIASRALDEWYRPYAAKDMPGVRLCYIFVHLPGTLHSKVKITSPDQMRGVKVRPATDMLGEWMKSLGAIPVSLSAPQSAEALAKGAADAITFPFQIAYTYKVDKFTQYAIDVPMYTSVQANVMNPATYDAMSPAQKKVIDKNCNADWSYNAGKSWSEDEQAGYARMKADPAHTFVRLSPVELAQWKRSATPLVLQWSDQMRQQGYNPEKMLNDLNRILLKYRSKM